METTSNETIRLLEDLLGANLDHAPSGGTERRLAVELDLARACHTLRLEQSDRPPAMAARSARAARSQARKDSMSTCRAIKPSPHPTQVSTDGSYRRPISAVAALCRLNVPRHGVDVHASPGPGDLSTTCVTNGTTHEHSSSRSEGIHNTLEGI